MITVRDHRFEPGTIMNLGDYIMEKAEFDYMEKQMLYKMKYNKTHTKRKKKPCEQKALSEEELNKQVIEVLRDDRKEPKRKEAKLTPHMILDAVRKSNEVSYDWEIRMPDI